MGNNGLTEQQLENVKKEISGYKDLANARWWMVKSPERCKYYSGFYDGIVQALKIIGIEESNG